MLVNKITTGWVTQTYDGPHCIRQEFFAGDIVEYQDEKDNPVDPIKDEYYQSFEMVQPKLQRGKPIKCDDATFHWSRKTTEYDSRAINLKMRKLLSIQHKLAAKLVRRLTVESGVTTPSSLLDLTIQNAIRNFTDEILDAMGAEVSSEE